MEKDFDNLDINTLKQIHFRENQLLKEALLNGHSWDEVQVLRKRITLLSIIIHKKRNEKMAPDSDEMAQSKASQ